MTKITELTSEQTARMAEYRDKWIAIGLSTEPADRPRAERAIPQMYAAAKLPPPRVVWCSSPLSLGFTRAIVLDKTFWESVGASVGESVLA